MLDMAKARDVHDMWERRLRALQAMYARERPCFVDRDGEWCLRDFLDYASEAMGYELHPTDGGA